MGCVSRENDVDSNEITIKKCSGCVDGYFLQNEECIQILSCSDDFVQVRSECKCLFSKNIILTQSMQ